MTVTQEKRLAYVLLRLTLGVNLLGHGFIRLLHGDATFAAGMVKSMADAPLPAGFVYAFGFCTPIIELALGLLLVAGLATRWALISASFFMTMLMVGITLKQDWPTAGVQLGYGAVIAALLFLRADYDTAWTHLLRRAQ